jgi:hypothetical protein
MRPQPLLLRVPLNLPVAPPYAFLDLPVAQAAFERAPVVDDNLFPHDCS